MTFFLTSNLLKMILTKWSQSESSNKPAAQGEQISRKKTGKPTRLKANKKITKINTLLTSKRKEHRPLR